MHAIPRPLILCSASRARKALLPFKPAQVDWILRAAAASSKVYLNDSIRLPVAYRQMTEARDCRVHARGMVYLEMPTHSRRMSYNPMIPLIFVAKNVEYLLS